MREDAGFTLLELLLSLTILGVMMAILFGGLRVGVRAWEKGEANVAAQQRYRQVLSQLQRQMAAMNTTSIQGLGNRPFYLDGAADSLSFLSRVSLAPANDLGMVFVDYRVRETAGQYELVVYEKNYVLIKDRNDQEMIPDDKFLPLLETSGELRFEYLQSMPERTFGEAIPAEEPEPIWVEEWPADEMKAFPKAVRVVFQEDGDAPPIYVMVPIHWDESKNG